MYKNLISKVSIVLASLAVTTGAYAHECHGCAKEVKMPNGTCGPCLANSEPHVDSCSSNTTFSVLYQRACVAGTEIGYTDNGTFTQLPIVGNILRPTFGMDWGFKVGVGHLFELEDINTGIVFTHFRSTATLSAETTYMQLIIPCNVPMANVLGTGAGLSNIAPATAAMSEVDVRYYVLDFEVHRGSYFCKSLSFEPVVGLRMAKIDIEQSATFTGFENVSPIEEHSDLIHNNESDFSGIGPRFGLKTVWSICPGISLYGDFDVAILFGNINTNSETLFESSDPATSTDLPVRDRINAAHMTCSPMAHAVIGFQYDILLKECCQHFMLRAGLDATFWWNQNEVVKIDNADVTLPVCYSVQSNDFGLFGLIVDLRWDF